MFEMEEADWALTNARIATTNDNLPTEKQHIKVVIARDIAAKLELPLEAVITVGVRKESKK